ncbi:uncharacterized protein [Miscanthus floridulus]|uniref:uncharacterized protein n=1 Tax=Miscanthus floridulus TaxID=154761 RepID=UPI00345925E8
MLTNQDISTCVTSVSLIRRSAKGRVGAFRRIRPGSHTDRQPRAARRPPLGRRRRCPPQPFPGPRVARRSPSPPPTPCAALPSPRAAPAPAPASHRATADAARRPPLPVRRGHGRPRAHQPPGRRPSPRRMPHAAASPYVVRRRLPHTRQPPPPRPRVAEEEPVGAESEFPSSCRSTYTVSPRHYTDPPWSR